jgi:hypothetical protein
MINRLRASVECRVHGSAVFARVCGSNEDFPAVDEVFWAQVRKTSSHVPEKVGSGSRFELCEAPARYAERPVLFDEVSEAGLMGPGHDLDLGELKSGSLQHGSQFVWSVHELVLGDQRPIDGGAVAVEFLVPDIQCGSAPVVAPGGEADAASGPGVPAAPRRAPSQAPAHGTVRTP